MEAVVFRWVKTKNCVPGRSSMLPTGLDHEGIQQMHGDSNNNHLGKTFSKTLSCVEA